MFFINTLTKALLQWRWSRLLFFAAGVSMCICFGLSVFQKNMNRPSLKYIHVRFVRCELTRIEAVWLVSAAWSVN